tara:strand:- start:1981 stop:2829 length:849 start_codon:yes stop_codon:yes gene_type:complete
MHAVPGGPFDSEKTLSPEIQKNLEKKYNLDKPLYKQYFIYLNNLVHGDLGPSFKYKDYSVNELLTEGFPISATLGLSAMFIALIIGVSFGVIAAKYQNKFIDYCMMVFALIGMSIPGFVIAPLLVLILSIKFQLLPAGEWQGPFAFQYLILPVFALSLPMIAYITRIMRSSMVEILRSNFIRTARAKGLPEWKVLIFHALKPALLPVISFIGPALASIVTGSIVIEKIFGLPGIGQHFVQGAINRDYTLVMGVVIISALLIVICNLIVDIIYALIDPKVSYV